MAHLSYSCHLLVLSSRHSDGLAILFALELVDVRC